jgi:hypothetical protein
VAWFGRLAPAADRIARHGGRAVWAGILIRCRRVRRGPGQLARGKAWLAAAGRSRGRSAPGVHYLVAEQYLLSERGVAAPVLAQVGLRPVAPRARRAGEDQDAVCAVRRTRPGRRNGAHEGSPLHVRYGQRPVRPALCAWQRRCGGSAAGASPVLRDTREHLVSVGATARPGDLPAAIADGRAAHEHPPFPERTTERVPSSTHYTPGGIVAGVWFAPDAATPASGETATYPWGYFAPGDLHWLSSGPKSYTRGGIKTEVVWFPQLTWARSPRRMPTARW